MLRKVESTSDANRGSEPYQSATGLTFPFMCLYRPELSLRSMVQCGRMHMRTTIAIRVQIITPQTYIKVLCYSYSLGAKELWQ